MYDLLDDETPTYISPSVQQLLLETELFSHALTDCLSEISSTIAMDSAKEKYIPMSLLAHLVMTLSSIDLNVDEIVSIIKDTETSSITLKEFLNV